MHAVLHGDTRRALEGRHVLLAATGGSDRHALVIEHQLRPLFAFLSANILPLWIYAVNGDFKAPDELDTSVASRVVRAVDQIAHCSRKEPPWILWPPPASPSFGTSPETSPDNVHGGIVHRAAGRRPDLSCRRLPADAAGLQQLLRVA
jgi:hypothetical protein